MRIWGNRADEGRLTHARLRQDEHLEDPVNGSDESATRERWPALPLEQWSDTCDTLHLWTQVVGKAKLKLCPAMNEMWQVGMYPTPCGLTTGSIP